jgi:hypothetical protein
MRTVVLYQGPLSDALPDTEPLASCQTPNPNPSFLETGRARPSRAMIQVRRRHQPRWRMPSGPERRSHTLVGMILLTLAIVFVMVVKPAIF